VLSADPRLRTACVTRECVTDVVAILPKTGHPPVPRILLNSHHARAQGVTAAETLWRQWLLLLRLLLTPSELLLLPDIASCRPAGRSSMLKEPPAAACECPLEEMGPVAHIEADARSLPSSAAALMRSHCNAGGRHVAPPWAIGARGVGFRRKQSDGGATHGVHAACNVSRRRDEHGTHVRHSCSAGRVCWVIGKFAWKLPLQAKPAQHIGQSGAKSAEDLNSTELLHHQ